MSPRQGYILRVLIASMSVLITLCVLEVALRFLSTITPRLDQPTFLLEYDSVRGWRNIPGSRAIYSTREYSATIEYNSRAFRGPEPTLQKQPNTYRVLVLGDSFVDGYTVAFGERSSEVLQERLARDLGRPVEVIAMGTIGYSTDQELIWLEQEGLTFKPDLVVEMFYFNDVWDNTLSSYNGRSKPLFTLDGNQLILSQEPTLSNNQPNAAAWKCDLVETPNLNNLKRCVAENSRLYALMSRALANFVAMYNFTIGSGLTISSASQTQESEEVPPSPIELSVYRSKSTPSVAYAWNLTESLLERMRLKAENSGSRFVAFHVPIRASVYRGEWPLVTYLPFSGANWDVLQVGNDFRSLCAKDGLNCIEPTTLFAATAKDLNLKNERLYFKSDSHWTKQGHILAGNILAEYVLTNGFR